MRHLAASIAFGAAVFIALHELGRRWGATAEEVRRPMAGDDIVPHAKGRTTHTITIDAAAEDVWPWLVQMGYHEPVGTCTRGSIGTSGTSTTRARRR
jgi:hypothetical protein